MFPCTMKTRCSITNALRWNITLLPLYSHKHAGFFLKLRVYFCLQASENIFPCFVKHLHLYVKLDNSMRCIMHLYYIMFAWVRPLIPIGQPNGNRRDVLMHASCSGIIVVLLVCRRKLWLGIKPDTY